MPNTSPDRPSDGPTGAPSGAPIAPDGAPEAAVRPDLAATAAAIVEQGSTPYARGLGLVYTEITPTRVRAELRVADRHCTLPTGLHGGAIMSIADDMGAVGTVMNLPPGAGTSTIESKTNFVRGVPLRETVTAESTPIHLGRTTMVWQTRISRADGKLAAVVTQTQIVLAPKDGDTTRES